MFPLAALLDTAVRRMAGDAALFLVMGGLFMLGFVLLLVLLRSVFPSKPQPPPGAAVVHGRALRYTPNLTGPQRPEFMPNPPDSVDLEEGRNAAGRLKMRSMEQILDKLVENGWGEPRILRALEDRVHLRFYRCRDCEGLASRMDTQVHGCGFPQGFLEVAFQRLEHAHVDVHETACRRTGHGTCEFEVRYATPP